MLFLFCVQGLDVLEIMRNIHVFVSKYLYNLNNQVRSKSNPPKSLYVQYFLSISLFLSLFLSFIFPSFFYFSSFIIDLRGKVLQEQVPEHNQHPPRCQFHPHARHRHHEHDRQLHLSVLVQEVLHLFAVHV